MTPDVTVAEVQLVEWTRGPAAALDAALRSPSPPVRRAAAVALGRLRHGDALPGLRELLGDPVSAVRLAAIDALGWTPGAAPTLRELIAAPPAPPVPGEPSARVAAIAALGRAGDGSDVPLLVGLIAEPAPAGASAAEALGRLGRRGVGATEHADDALVRCIGRLDPRLVSSCSWALSRIGVRDPTNAGGIVARFDQLASEGARAWLIRAAWPGLDAEDRTTWFVRAIGGSSRAISVAALDAVEADQVPTDIVAPWLVHPDGWVRSAAIAALGRLDTADADASLTRLARDGDRWTAAAAIEAAGSSQPDQVADRALPAALRAAATAGLTDPVLLLALALEDPEPSVRSAAAGTLSERQDAGPKLGMSLLGAQDIAVREVGVDLVKGGSPDVGPAVLAAALVEAESELFHGLLVRLDELAAREPRAWTAARVAPVLARVPTFWSPRVASAARKLAERVGAPVPVPAAAPAERPLGEGSVAGPWPSADQLAPIRGARVRTDRGEFFLSLDAENAPVAVWNFALLADAGWYDGRLVHRLVPGFVAQTGCPRGDGWGGPGWTLPDEVSTVPFAEGSLGMARANPDTGGSQWFVTLADTPHLTGEYTRFGEVTHGMAVVRRLRRGDHILEVAIERIP